MDRFLKKSGNKSHFPTYNIMTLFWCKLRFLKKIAKNSKKIAKPIDKQKKMWYNKLPTKKGRTMPWGSRVRIRAYGAHAQPRGGTTLKRSNEQNKMSKQIFTKRGKKHEEKFFK
jgi:hypothetical protein